jgi:hypothetical protein
MIQGTLPTLREQFRLACLATHDIHLRAGGTMDKVNNEALIGDCRTP